MQGCPSFATMGFKQRNHKAGNVSEQQVLKDNDKVME
jgi:hypothetical protein